MTRYQDGLDVIGFGWQDGLALVHGVGKGVLSAFGAGSAGEAVEDVYKKQGWLPAKPGQPPTKGQPPAGVPDQRAVSQQAQIFASQREESERRRAEEDRRRFWSTLIVGVTLVGVGVVAWWTLGPKTYHHPAPPAPAPLPAPPPAQALPPAGVAR